MLGILLGVAIVTAVLITNNSSQRAFALSSEALYGRATHQLSGARGIDQAMYVKLRELLPDIQMTPVIQGHVAIKEQVYSILGLDPFSEFAFNRTGTFSESTANSSPATEQAGVESLLKPNAVLIGRASLEDSGSAIGQAIELTVGGLSVPAIIAGTFAPSNPAASKGLLIGDIAFVQTVLQRGSRIDRIDLILDEADVRRVQQVLPPTIRIDPAISRQQTMTAMTRGFHINLTAMSLLALVVGAFLIHNTMTFAVVQRRELFAIKRITGISAQTVLFSVLTEALVISLIGSILGIAMGYTVAHGLIKLTTQTINDLYFVLHVQEIAFSPWLIAAGLALGVGSSLIATSLSAIDAAATSPVQARQRSVIEERAHTLLPFFAMGGLLTMLVGLLLANLPAQSLLLGFAALMLIIVGYGMSLPWMIRKIVRCLLPLASRLDITLSLAMGGIERNTSRTGLAIAALTIAVSATFGVDIMIGSFRSTVDRWLGTTLQSDIYVSAPSAVSGQNSIALNPGIDALALKLPGVLSVSTGRSIEVKTQVGEIDMLVIKPHGNTDAGFELIATAGDQAWPHWASNEAVMISEPVATKHGLTRGDRLTIFTENQGNQSFEISAVFRDFGSSNGKILMHRQIYNRHWQDRQISTLGIMLENKGDDERVAAALRSTLATPRHPLVIQSNTHIHATSLAIFDRTFEVTRVLRWLTVGVAFVGIFSALLALHLERAREFAIIRATGATRHQIACVVLFQTFVMGALAGLLSLPLGWLMSEILIKVINVRSFGWTMESYLPSGSIITALLLACTSAVLAGLYPAFRLSRSHIANQLRDE